jgi:hypothetical protein
MNEMIGRQIEVLAEENDSEEWEREKDEDEDEDREGNLWTGAIPGEEEYEHEGSQGQIFADNGRRKVQYGEDVIGEVVALSELEADDEADF